MSRFGTGPGDPGTFEQGAQPSRQNSAEVSAHTNEFREATFPSQKASLTYRDATEIKAAELQGFNTTLVLGTPDKPKVALSDNGHYLAVAVDQSLGFVTLPTENSPQPKMSTHFMSEFHRGSGGVSEITFAKTSNVLHFTTCADGAKAYRLAFSEEGKQPPVVLQGTPAHYLSGLQALSPGGEKLAHCYFNQGRSTSVTICPVNIDFLYAPEAVTVSGSVRAMRFNADGSLLAIGSDSGHLLVHSGAILSREAPISVKLKGSISSVGFGGDTVFAGTQGGALIALTPGEKPDTPIIRFSASITEGAITAIAPSGPDNAVLVGTSEGEIFRVTRDGAPQLLGKCSQESINSISVSADGRTVAVGLCDGGALLFTKE